jgi:50S ribosomal subunit-associated GTPase HflX
MSYGGLKLHLSLYALVQHVLDSSAPDLAEHRSTVLQVLQQIGVSQDKINNMIEVWNKVPIEI